MDTEEAALYYLIVLASLAISAVLMYFFFATIRRHAIYQRAYKKEIDSALNKLEDERTWIAADLHDDLGPLLSAIKINIMAMAPANPEDEKLQSKCIAYINDTTSKMRTIAHGLMPAVLINKGLIPAIEQFTDDLNFNQELEIEVNTIDLPSLKQQSSIHIYRVLQEIIHNTFKHALATRLIIDIRIEKYILILATTDNGRGFNEKAVKQAKKGFGLSNLQSRVELMEGRYNIKTAPGKGTSYAIEIPLTGIIYIGE